MKQISATQIQHNNKLWNCIFKSPKMTVFSEDKGDWKSYLLVGSITKQEFKEYLHKEIDSNNSIAKMNYLSTCMTIKDLLQYDCPPVVQATWNK